MTAFSPNIPQPGDNPSVSQDQILQNFQTLNAIYGTSGDHYPWTDTNSIEVAKHAKVTLPGLPTSSAPGNILPITVIGNCAIFAQSADPNLGPTYPYIVRDGLVPTAPLTNIWPLLPIKAYGSLTATAINAVSINDQFNVSSVTASGGSPNQTFTVNLVNAMKSTNYGVILTNTRITSAESYSIISNNQFRINTNGIPSSFIPYSITFIVVQS